MQQLNNAFTLEYVNFNIHLSYAKRVPAHSIYNN